MLGASTGRVLINNRPEECLQEKVRNMQNPLLDIRVKVKVKLGAYADAARGLGAHLHDIGP